VRDLSSEELRVCRKKARAMALRFPPKFLDVDEVEQVARIKVADTPADSSLALVRSVARRGCVDAARSALSAAKGRAFVQFVESDYADSGEPSPFQSVYAEELRREVRRAVDELPSAEREVVLYFLATNRLSPVETRAAQVAASRRFLRARVRLASRLRGLGLTGPSEAPRASGCGAGAGFN
jgi:hypothetical protein